MWQRYQFGLLMLIALTLAGCKRTRSITVNELRSKIQSAISLASESELFIAQIENGRLTRQFQAGQASYLRKEAADLSQELGQSQVDLAQMHNLKICSEQLQLLVRELTALQVQSDHTTPLAGAMGRVEIMRKSLEAAKAGL